MKGKKLEEKFSAEIDAYLNGTTKIDKSSKPSSEEYNELLEIGKMLADQDFSKNSNKEEIFKKTLKNIDRYKGEDNMKKVNKIRRPIAKVASFALVCILGISLMQTSFAQNFMDKVVKTITLGHITIVQDEPETKSYPIPDELKGKVFDKDGNPVEVFSKDKKIYTADGEEIVGFDFEREGIIITAAQAQQENEMMKEKTLIVKDPNKLNNYTCFNVILPSYLPKGYAFDRAEFYKDEKGVVENTKYINLYFTNKETGKYIFMQQRFADDETAYEAGTDGKIEKIKINGVDAIMSDNRTIDLEANGVLYSLHGRGIAKNELIKIAESIKSNN